MSVLILTVRPQPGSDATVAAGRAAGLTIEACPLFELRSVPWDAPPAEAIDGLLLGSANAVRLGGPALQAFRGKPAYVVGKATASAAEAAGFPVARTGAGQLQPLVDTLVPPLGLLRVTGADHVPIAPPGGVVLETRVAYASIPLPLPADYAARLGEGAVVLLHSAVAAGHFASECSRLGVPRSSIRLAALGPRIAAAAGGGWGAVRSAAAPDEAALLALAHDLCHEPPLR